MSDMFTIILFAYLSINAVSRLILGVASTDRATSFGWLLAAIIPAVFALGVAAGW
jgi:hypothetical protein